MLLVASLYFSLSQLHELELLWLALLALPLSLVLGDLVSGLVHWTADTYFSEETPIIGPSLVKPFRLHHLYPRDICTHDLVTTVGNVCIIAVPVLAVCISLLWFYEDSSWLAFIILCIALMSLATVLTNQFHKWAHLETPSRFVRLLQRTRLVLAPRIIRYITPSHLTCTTASRMAGLIQFSIRSGFSANSKRRCVFWESRSPRPENEKKTQCDYDCRFQLPLAVAKAPITNR